MSSVAVLEGETWLITRGSESFTGACASLGIGAGAPALVGEMVRDELGRVELG
jgi:hypothetical protein